MINSPIVRNSNNSSLPILGLGSCCVVRLLLLFCLCLGFCFSVLVCSGCAFSPATVVNLPEEDIVMFGSYRGENVPMFIPKGFLNKENEGVGWMFYKDFLKELNKGESI